MRHVSAHIKGAKTPKKRYYIASHIMLLNIIHISVETAQDFLEFIDIDFPQSYDISELKI